MSILVSGANGFVGRHLCASLAQHEPVIGMVRRAGSCPPEAREWLVPDWSELPQAAHAAALHGKVRAVVHLAARVHVMRDTAEDPLSAFRAVNVLASLELLRLAAAIGARRFVFVSSIKALGDLEPGVPPHPWTETDTPHPDDPYGQSKLEAERLLQAEAARLGLEWVIVRPPLVYGPGVGANFLSLMRAVARRRPLPLGAVRGRRSMLYVGNLVAFLVLVLGHEAAANQDFLVSDGPAMQLPDLVRALATEMGVAPRLWHVPPSLLQVAGILSGRRAQVARLTGSLRLDDGKARRLLGWRAPFDTAQGLAATVAGWPELSRKPS